jgi:ElaB/YqjD/DUF883 family membrane-anchored ribosome-binding protein
MSSTTDFRDDPSAIERDNEEIRADMNATLDALGRKLSPGQLIDSSVNILRDHGAEFAANLGRQAKANPVPLLITSIGLIWLLASRNQSSADRGRATYGTDDYRSQGYSGYSEGASDEDRWSTGGSYRGNGNGATSEDTGPGVKERVQEAAAHLKERVHDGAAAAREKLRASRERIRASKERAVAGKDTAMGRVGSVARSTRTQARRAKDSFSTLVDEQPLALGAIGIAIGAIIGASLPNTRREDELLGRTRDRALERAKEVGSQQYAKVREKATTAAERAQEAAMTAFKGNDQNADYDQSGAQGTTGAQRDEGLFKGESTPMGRA